VVNPFVAQVDCQQISVKGGLLPVCQMLWPTDERTEDETEANARLIAAAPELYEALEAVLTNNRKGVVGEAARKAWLKAGAALAKARGEA
jgi:hypothetical protein